MSDDLRSSLVAWLIFVFIFVYLGILPIFCYGSVGIHYWKDYMWSCLGR